MTDERLEEIRRLTWRPDAYGFRSECVELAEEVLRLREANDRMRGIRFEGDYGPAVVADTLEHVAKACDSSLHEMAALMLRRLMTESAAAKDAAADAGEALSLLRRVVGNLDVRCRPDHHGYCQEHNFAAPCPVPAAHKLTGSGLEYVPNCVGR